MDDDATPVLAERPPKRQKQMTVIACNSCKRRKSKCNGARPTCDRCLRLNEQCHYELDSTISRQDGLKRRLREVTAKADALEAIVAQLRSASDGDAVNIIRQLRSGADVSDVADRPSAPSSSRLSSVAAEDNYPSYPSPPIEDLASKGLVAADWRAIVAQHADQQDDDRDQSSAVTGSTRSSTPWDSSSPLPRDHRASVTSESDLPPLIPQRKRQELGPLTVYRGYVESFGNLPMSSSIMAGHYPDSVQRQQVSNFQIPVHFLQPCWAPDSSPFSRVIQDYRNLARQAYSTSAPALDGSRVDVTYFFRDRAPAAITADGAVPSVSTWASEMNRTFEDVDVFVRLAALYFQSKLMLWMINPTAETYAMMPELIRPTPAQMMVPHISPVDTVPIPAMRDALLDNLRDWVSACAGSLSVNWPYGLDACVEQDPVTGHLYLAREFLEHAADPANWTVGSNFFKIFPELRGRIASTDRPRRSESPDNRLGIDTSLKPPTPGTLRASMPLSLRNAAGKGVPGPKKSRKKSFTPVTMPKFSHKHRPRMEEPRGRTLTRSQLSAELVINKLPLHTKTAELPIRAPEPSLEAISET